MRYATASANFAVLGEGPLGNSVPCAIVITHAIGPEAAYSRRGSGEMADRRNTVTTIPDKVIE